MNPREDNNLPTAVVDQYRRRDAKEDAHRYGILNAATWQMLQERQRAMYRLFRDVGLADLSRLRLVEVGAGEGGNLLDFLRMGFAPENVQGIELLPERLARARRVLPSTLRLILGDATQIDVPENSCDIVFQAVVFSSLLDPHFRRKLAQAMWRWVTPGGGVLWYDFIYNNPANPDVRGVPLHQIKDLFPDGGIVVRRVTLAPPIARRVVIASPWLYHVLNAIPLLRTHVLCWIEKKR